MPLSLPKGSSIAQLIVVPYVSAQQSKNERGNAGFGSTVMGACLPITESRSKLTLCLNERLITGLLGTGADVTILPLLIWPSAWPL